MLINAFHSHDENTFRWWDNSVTYLLIIFSFHTCRYTSNLKCRALVYSTTRQSQLQGTMYAPSTQNSPTDVHHTTLTNSIIKFRPSVRPLHCVLPPTFHFELGQQCWRTGEVGRELNFAFIRVTVIHQNRVEKFIPLPRDVQGGRTEWR